MHFSSKKFTTFLVVALQTQSETAKLTTPTLQISPAQQKFPQKLNSCSAWGALTTFACKMGPQIFLSALGGARAPSVCPGYAYSEK